MPSHILIADDDSVSRSVLQHVLAERGHSIVQADNGLAALDLIGREYFDLAIFDYHMPILDGVSAARRAVSRAGRGARPRFIGVTADPNGLESRDRANEIFDAIVQKPINLIAFLGVVEASLRLQRASVTAQAILAQWQACGLDRCPRAVLAGGIDAEPGRGFDMFDFSRPENPDIVLLTPATPLGAIEMLRTAGNLFTVPMIDTGGRWSEGADGIFLAEDRRSWHGVASRALAFAGRRVQLTSRFLSATTLPDQLLAYIFVSGRDLQPVEGAANEGGLQYTGLFPAHSVQFAAQRLVQQGLLRRPPWANGSEAGAAQNQAMRFGLTEAAVALLTGALATEAFPKASFV